MDATYNPQDEVICPRRFFRENGEKALAERLRLLSGYVIQQSTLYDLCEALDGGLHLLCQGEPGSGKTMLGESLALAFNNPCDFLACHEELSKEDLLGYFDDKLQDRAYRRAIEMEARTAAEAEACQWTAACYRMGAFIYPFHFRATTGVPAMGIWDEVEKLKQAREIMAYEILARGYAHIRDMKPNPLVGITDGGDPPLIVATTNNMKSGEKRGDKDSLTEPFRDRFITTFVNTPGLAERINIIRTQVPEISINVVKQVVKIAKEIELMPEVQKKPTLRRIITLTRSLARQKVTSINADILLRKLCYLGTQERDRKNLKESVALLVKRSNASMPEIDSLLTVEELQTV
jgi:MoxR-like ATPase